MTKIPKLKRLEHPRGHCGEYETVCKSDAYQRKHENRLDKIHSSCHICRQTYNVVSRLWLNCSALLTSTKWGEQSMSPQGHRGDSPPLRVSVWDQPHNRNAERGPLLLSLSSLLPSKPRKERQDLLLPLAAHASRQRDAFFPFILKIGLTRLWGFRQRGLWIHLWCH